MNLSRSEGTQRTGRGVGPGAPPAIGASAPADPPREPTSRDAGVGWNFGAEKLPASQRLTDSEKVNRPESGRLEGARAEQPRNLAEPDPSGVLALARREGFTLLPGGKG